MQCTSFSGEYQMVFFTYRRSEFKCFIPEYRAYTIQADWDIHPKVDCPPNVWRLNIPCDNSLVVVWYMDFTIHYIAAALCSLHKGMIHCGVVACWNLAVLQPKCLTYSYLIFLRGQNTGRLICSGWVSLLRNRFISGSQCICALFQNYIYNNIVIQQSNV